MNRREFVTGAAALAVVGPSLSVSDFRWSDVTGLEPELIVLWDDTVAVGTGGPVPAKAFNVEITRTMIEAQEDLDHMYRYLGMEKS